MLSGGSRGTIIADGHINLAVGDNSAFRLASFFLKHDGYLNDGEQDENGKSVRLQFLTQQGAVNIKLDADYHNQGGYGGGYAVLDQSFFAGVASNTMVYSMYSTGYHAGGFFFANVVNPGDTNTYNPERIRALTLGVKTRLLENRLTLDVELFRWNLRDQQATLTTVDVFNNLFFKTLNVGSSLRQGVEFDAQLRPERNMLLGPKSRISTRSSRRSATRRPSRCNRSSPAPPPARHRSSTSTVRASARRKGHNGPSTSTRSRPFDRSGGSNIVLGVATHCQSETLVGFNHLRDDYQKRVWTGEGVARQRSVHRVAYDLPAGRGAVSRRPMRRDRR